MLSMEELDQIAAADEARLGVNSREFIQRHNEIMELINKAQEKGGEVNVKADHECQRRCGSLGSE